MARLLVPRHLLERDRSTSKLSEVAKRIAIPSTIVGTDWGPVAETCRKDMGITFDGWQDGMGQLMLARDTEEPLGPDTGGILAHTVDGFHLSAMRQIGKTYLFAGGIFGMSQHYPDLLTVWSAHHSTTHEETFEAMQGFAARAKVRPFIEQIFKGSGDEEIRFWNGSRILFGARERGFGRGIPGVDVLVSDEGQIMSERARQNMIATMNTSWLGLHIYAGTPPAPGDKSEGWMRKRDQAWVVEDPDVVMVESDGMVWVEFGASDDADLDDVEEWAKNPSVPHRTPFHAVQRLRSNLDDDGFRREGLGLYDKAGDSIFDLKQWERLIDHEAPEPERAALVVDISPNRKWSSLGIAGASYDDKTLLLVRSIPGTRTVAKAVKDLNDEQDLAVIKITPGAARVIETDLVKLGIDYSIMPSASVAAAYGELQEKVRGGDVVHVDQPELLFALENCKSRMLQTGEAESFDRRDNSVDISPAVAVAGALYEWGMLEDPDPFFL